MRDVTQKVIDGETYTFYQLPPRKSLKLLTRILKILGPAFGAALGNNPNVESIMEANLNPGLIVAELCSRLDENEVEIIVDTLLSQVHHAGKGELSQILDAHFAGRLPHLFRVIFTALEVEYGDFFGGKLADLVQGIWGRSSPQELVT